MKMRYELVGAMLLAPLALLGGSAEDQQVADFLKRADSGDEPAILGVAGDLYLKGRGVSPDWGKAMNYYRQALSNGVDEVSGKLAFLEFVLADPDLFAKDRAKALAAAIARDAEKAQEFAKKKFGIPQVDEVLHELALQLTPHDGHWHGIELADEWAANIRTNKNLKSSLDFCEQDWVPFVCREWFGDKDRDAAWYPDAKAIVERAVRNWWRARSLRMREEIYADAMKLVKGGCDNVAIRWLAGFSLKKGEALEWLSNMEADVEKFHSPELGRFLIAMARRHWLRSDEARRNSVDRAIDWIKARKFPKSESRCVYRTLATINHPVKPQMATELRLLPDVDPAIADALDEKADGLPPFPELGGLCVKEAPGNEGEAAFAAASAGMFDDSDLNFKYIFYNLLPRWGGSVELLEKFGNACYDAQRFDSMLPITFLDAQFFLATEQDIPFERHFADKERFAKCMRCCDALVGNEKVYTYVRFAATYYKAMLTYCAGDLSTLKTFFTDEYVHKMMPPVYMIEVAENYGGMVGALAALSGADADRLVPLHQKFRDGQYDGFIAESKRIEEQGGLGRESLDYLHMYRKISQLKSQGYDGSWVEADLVTSAAELFTRFPDWHRDGKGQGWFVPPKHGKLTPIKWNMPLGDNYELEVGLNPLIGSGYSKATIQYWVPHYQNQPLPELNCEFVKGKVNVWLSESGEDEDRWESKVLSTQYKGGITRVRIQYLNGSVSVWLGDGIAANLTTDRFASSFASVKGRGGSSVICAKGLCVRSWKGRKIK